MHSPLTGYFRPFHTLALSLCVLGCWCIIALTIPSRAHAMGLIRDTEIEQTLHAYVKPILQQANLAPDSVSLFIVNDPSINAFVAGGSNIFIHTGLLLASDDPAMLVGVLAHEVGHIAGGHLARGAEAIQDAQLSTVIGYVLGAAAALGGGARAGSAVMSASQQFAQRNFLSFTRMNEQSADQAALEYLDGMHISASGLLALMERLRTRETVYKNRIAPYARTHPLSKERIAHIRGHLLQSDIAENLVPKAFVVPHQRMHAKLAGFIQKPETILATYNNEDNSTVAHYARAIAYHRLTQTEPALREIDLLLRDAPRDPFYLELKGQILAESGKEQQALSYYKQALDILPLAPLLLAEYGRLLLAISPPDTTEAIRALKSSTLSDATNGMSWRLLGQAYQQQGDEGHAALSYAEASTLSNSLDEALRTVRRALELLPSSSPSRLRAEDLQSEIIRQKERESSNK